ncbi:VIP peptides [Dromiciops gliroides]|uniref:VIP peptides n=1 Tax=Dromiciops gliroides TaxID=33562 RepID=UPI001CC471A2|nr:VIP peptides [Dromiciops gliroides]
MSGYTKMEARSNFQLLVSLMLLSLFCSQTLALPLETYSAMRGNGMLFDEPDQNLGLLNLENDQLESVLPENDLSFLDAPRSLISDLRKPKKRHSDGIFTHNYSELLRRQALKKYLDSLLKDKRSDKNNPEEGS